MEEPVNALSIFPAEIWCHIFKHLDSKSLCLSTRVCKDWSAIIRFDPSFGSMISLPKNVTHSRAKKIIAKWPKVKTVVYHGQFKHRYYDPKPCSGRGKPNWRQMRIANCPHFEDVTFCVSEPMKWMIYKDPDESFYDIESFHCDEFTLSLKALEDEINPMNYAYPICLSQTEPFRHYEDADVEPDPDSDDHFGKMLQLDFYDGNQVICKLVSKATQLKYLEYSGGSDDYEKAFLVASQKCTRLREITLDRASRSRESSDYNVSELHLPDFFANKFEFPTLSTFDVTLYKITLPSKWPNVTRLELQDCDITDGWMQLPLAFPSLRELYTSCKDNDSFFSKDYLFSDLEIPTFVNLKEKYSKEEALRKKQVSDFFEAITCIEQFKRLEKFKWNTLLGGYHKKGTNLWESTLRQQGHDILANYLNKLRADCDVKIVLEKHKKKLMTFSKKGQDVAWTTYQPESADLVCRGEPNCFCNDIQVVHEEIDVESEELPENKKAKIELV